MNPLFRTVLSIPMLLYKMLSSLKMWALSILGKRSTTKSCSPPDTFGFRAVRPPARPRGDPMEIIPGYWDARNLCFIEDQEIEIVPSTRTTQTAEAGLAPLPPALEVLEPDLLPDEIPDVDHLYRFLLSTLL